MAVVLTWLISRQESTLAALVGQNSRANSQTVGLSSVMTLGANENYRGGGDITISGDALLPDSGVIGTSADILDVPKSDQISIYVVHPGDSLSGIAQMFDVSVNTIVWANDLTPGVAIHEGQTLTILPVTGLQHTVTKGETVQSIAKKYGGDVKEIYQFNGLTADSALAIGQVVLIPDGEETPASASASAGKPARPVRGSGGPSYPGYFLRPISGGLRTQGLHGHNGVDLASHAGAEIMAAAAGQVIVSKTGGWNGGYGSYVVIDHPNGTQTLYAHLQNSIVFVGQSVVRGQVIGYMGSTGKATGPHLHFEVHGAKNPF